MTEPRTAACRCGQLSVTCTGEPVRASACHCLECKARSGSAFAAQVRFPVENVAITGASTAYVHTGSSGNPATFHFCPTCGGGLYYINAAYPETIAVALGNFENPWFATPSFSVFESRKMAWVEIVGEGIEHD
jgi:hypothetical protein